MKHKNEALALALKASGVVPKEIETIMFNKKKILKAWKVCKKHFGKSLQSVPEMAHRIVLETNWLETNSKKLSRIIYRFLNNFKELPIESFQGKLEKKIPGIMYDPGTTNCDKAEVRSNVAAIIVELLLDNKIVKSHVVTKGSGKNTRHHTVIDFGGEDVEVDLFRGLFDEPGQMIQTHVGFERLSTFHRELLEYCGQMKFKLSDLCTDDLVLHGYQLSAEYNSHSKSEKSAHRHDRHDNSYIMAIQELRKKSVFYLPMFYDDRGRENYYFSRVFGVRPGGKLWETCNIDRAVPKILTEPAVKHIKHIIYTLIHGKFSVDYAMRHFKDSDYEYAKNIDPLMVPVPDIPYGDKGQNARVYREAESEFGKYYMLNKAAAALDMYYNGVPCPYLFGKDLTNSGLIMAGNCFKSELMLRGGNMWGLKTVADSHMQFGKAHKIEHLPRVEIKDIHTPLMHGSYVTTIVDKLHKYVPNPEDFTVDNVREHNLDAYGIEVENIEIISAWGADVVTNYQNILKWKTDDGFPACHKATMKRTPFSVYAASTRNKGGKPFKEYKVMATMPLALDSSGRCVYGKDNTTALSSKGVEVGTRGLFANLTHSFDAQLLRRIIAALRECQEVGLFKHDDYMLSPDMFDMVIEICQEYFVYLQDNNPYASSLAQISGKLRKPARAPKLYRGNATCKVRDSFNFLMV